MTRTSRPHISPTRLIPVVLALAALQGCQPSTAPPAPASASADVAPPRDEAVAWASAIAPAPLAAGVAAQADDETEAGQPEADDTVELTSATGKFTVVAPKQQRRDRAATITIKLTDKSPIEPGEFAIERTSGSGPIQVVGNVEKKDREGEADHFTATIKSSGNYTITRRAPAPEGKVALAFSPSVLGVKPRIIGLIDVVKEGAGEVRYETKIGTVPGPYRNNPSATRLIARVEAKGDREVLVVDADGNILGRGPVAKEEAETLDIEIKPRGAGVQRLFAADSWALTSGDGGGVNMIHQDRDEPGGRVLIRAKSENRYLAPTPVGASGPVTADVFDGFLRLVGSGGASTTLRFPVFARSSSDSGTFAREPRDAEAKDQRSGEAGAWDVVLDLSSRPAPNTYRVLAVDERSNSGQGFSQAVEFTPAEAIKAVAPTIKKVIPDPNEAQSSGGTEETNGLLTHASRLIISGEGVSKEAFDAGAVVAVFQEGDNDPIAVIKGPLDKDGAWSGPLSALADGDHALRAFIVQGDHKSDPSEPYHLGISRTGPTIEEYVPFDFGVRSGAQTLTIRFRGNRLNGAAVGEKANYEILRDTDGSLKYEPPAGSLLTEAVYEQATNSIHLKFNNLPASNYQVALTGSETALRDVYGNPIKGHSGDPDRQLVRKFERTTAGGSGGSGLAGARGRLAALETATIPAGRRGEFVTYPEFVEPRAPTNGFNPADKVETRVVRLYYNRDAHRVAQIVNRHVESYNRVAVDTRRRLAVETRREADDLTDGRRVGELRAIRAAELARAAERELQQATEARDDLDGRGERAQAQAPILRRRIERNKTALAATADVEEQRRLQGLIDADQLNLDKAERDLAAADDGGTAARDRVTTARRQVETARDEEAAARMDSARETFAEDRAREQQFRLEVAAAHEDPDTYAPGRPSSIDPVEQVSVSVVGEAMIQLRGPMKGINIVRKMINELDGPAGQVRIAIHTVQINGEHGDRMEKVATKIKDYIDHSRFLTAQSGQYLRNAVVRVASRRALEAAAECEDERTQDARDHKYVASFFGEDFLRELMKMDSEFLRTGNKVLSIHSMDTTSLASALFLMALAKNETRMEILDEFRTMLATELPEAELSYYQAGGDRDPGKKHPHPHKKDEFVLLANNARFQSLMGYFEHQVDGNDTLNPIQREFIRLAQIYKSRLVTEMEYNQRVRERAIIEERLGDRIQELTKQRDRREAAEKAVAKQQETLNRQRAEIFNAFVPLGNQIRAAQTRTNQAANAMTKIIEVFKLERNARALAARLEQLTRRDKREAFQPDAEPFEAANKEYKAILDEAVRLGLTVKYGDLLGEKAIAAIKKDLSGDRGREPLDAPPSSLGGVMKNLETLNAFSITINDQLLSFYFSPKDPGKLTLLSAPVGVSERDAMELARGQYQDWKGLAKAARTLLDFHRHDPSDDLDMKAVEEAYQRVLAVTPEKELVRQDFWDLMEVFKVYVRILEELQQLNQTLIARFNKMLGSLGDGDVDIQGIYRDLQDMRAGLARKLRGEMATQGDQIFDKIDEAFRPLFETDVQRQFAEKALRDAREAFDHKKLLDMHIDDMEEKYIELLEGTRAHIAVVDGYIKSLATALDDDFNTQFYEPAFRRVREASRLWDVQLGQIEKTSVLTNNRGFGKVSPTATMEFDLPKRDILITEAMNGAKAMMDEYGALLNDPTFLALTKLRSGQPTSSMAQGTLGGGASAVRSVLPELSRSDDEEVLRQAGPGRREFGSALEALIPDPAIYKFETGTGYEVRPVIQPDGQAVTFDFDYMYTTNVREPVRADEKHLGRVKRHFIHTPVQLTNYELREVSTYQVALKASRTSRGVPLLEDVPGVGVLFRPLPNAESSLQENIVLAHGAIFPTLFDLMGLRWAPAVADLDPLRLRNDDFIVRSRHRDLSNRTFDVSSSRVDEFMRTPEAERRADLYRSQETIPSVHPNGYRGPGLNLKDSRMREGYDPRPLYPPSRHVPGASPESGGLPGDDVGLPVEDLGAASAPLPDSFSAPPPSAPPAGVYSPMIEETDSSYPGDPSNGLPPALPPSAPLREGGPPSFGPASAPTLAPPAAAATPTRRDSDGRRAAAVVIPPPRTAPPATASTSRTRPPLADPGVRRAAASAAPAAPAPEAERKSLLSRLRGR